MKKPTTSRKSETNWDRILQMKDEDIDFSDHPEATAEMFAKAIVRKGLKPVLPKPQITLRIDQDVIDFFKAQGRGYQTRINQLLRAYMEAHKIS
jgi:uncharacterized protein (DUF4415 family)